MKLGHSLLRIIWFLGVIDVSGQTRGNADPSGFHTLSVGGAGTTYLGLGLTRPVEYQRTASAIGSNTITDDGASWSVNQFAGSYFVEITSVNGSTSAVGVGTTYGIVSNSTNALTLSSNLASGIAAPVGYKIRKEWTLSNIFGASNSAGLQGGTAETADLVQLWNGSNLESYYYLASRGWRKVGDTSTDAGGTVIPFYRAVLVKRQGSTAVSFALSGTAKTGLSTIPIAAGDNYLGNVCPTNLTLAGSGLYTGDSSTGIAPGDASSADLVMFWNGTGFDSYYYLTGKGWRKVGDTSTDASSKVIGEGTGFILRRLNGSSFNWRLPEILTSSAAAALPGQLLNISTRGFVQTGDNVLIGGFIITGTEAKKIVLRAIGPSLSAAGLGNVLSDPSLELRDASGVLIASNDNWADGSNASEITTAGLAPSQTNESALLQTLAPAAYTAIVRGVSSTTGIGLVEVYDLSTGVAAKLANISTRGFVGTDNNVMIGGFILGAGSTRVVVRALGPSLGSAGVVGALSDPNLTLVNSSGTVVAANDNWASEPNASAIQAAGLAPGNSAEAATLQTLAAGAYTAIVRGNSNTSGVALIEVYALD